MNCRGRALLHFSFEAECCLWLSIAKAPPQMPSYINSAQFKQTLALASIIWFGGCPITSATTLTTNGNNSPAVLGNNNKIYINDIPAGALKHLNELLDIKDLQLKAKVAEANEWARKYRELNNQISKSLKDAKTKGESTGPIKVAQDLLRSGKLKEAGDIYDQLINRDERDVDRVSEDHFSRASIYSLEFQFADALREYEIAYRYRPNNVKYAYSYATALINHRNDKLAEPILISLIDRFRTSDDDRYELAVSLETLGDLYTRSYRHAEAEKELSEAIAILRPLATKDFSQYGEPLADALEKIGFLYINEKNSEAELALKESIEIRRKLLSTNSTDGKWNLASSVGYLGNLYNDIGRLDEAEKSSIEANELLSDVADIEARRGEALNFQTLALIYSKRHNYADAEKAILRSISILRPLAEKNPPEYDPPLVQGLYRASKIYSDMGNSGEAQTLLSEAIPKLRTLDEANPAGFNRIYSFALSDFCVDLINAKKLQEAEAPCKQQIPPFRSLAQELPNSYLPSLAQSLHNLGWLYYSEKEFGDAETSFKEASQLMRQLAAENPDKYRSELIASLQTLGLVYEATHNSAAKIELGKEIEALRASQKVEK